MYSYFLIVSRQDVPLYEAELSAVKKDDASHLHQFILHAALDFVEERQWDTSNCYLKAVDKFNDLLVSAYVTSGQARLLLLHDGRLHEDGVRAFFGDVHEAYVKAAMSPFHNGRTPITSARFDALVRGAAKRHLLQ